jgi:dihydrofolate synthase/folylpolyglutamate synthase
VTAGVIEVGLGGRLDATNVLSPLVSVITPIDHDHTSILGNKLAEIAQEKAGIIKEGVPVVMAPQPMEARASILRTAADKRARVIEVGSDVLYESVDSNIHGQQFNVWEKVNPGKIRFAIKLLGKHQVENATTALATLRVANGRGLQISDEAIARGFAVARWPGRFEIVRNDPPVVLDAAHSPAAAKALRAALDEYFPGRPVIIVLGVSADKDLAGVIGPLRDRVVSAIATQSSHPRAMPAAELRAKLARIGTESEAVADAKVAIEGAIDMVRTDEVVLVCGSVFLVELAHEIFNKHLS